jgi:hypothetical protein
VPEPELCSELLVPDLVAFAHGGVAVFVGSSSVELVPALTRGFAPRVAPDRRTLDVFVGRAQSATSLINLVPGRPMTITLASPIDYRGIQVKGRSAGWGDPAALDAAWLDDYWRLFKANLDQVGFPPEYTTRLRCRDVVRITLMPAAIFRQTPGPGAGSAVEGGSRWA